MLNGVALIFKFKLGGVAQIDKPNFTEDVASPNPSNTHYCFQSIDQGQF